MDERQLVCYPKDGTCSFRGSVCCVLLTFPSKSPCHDQNVRCCPPPPFKECNCLKVSDKICSKCVKRMTLIEIVIRNSDEDYDNDENDKFNKFKTVAYAYGTCT